ncbi:hypothetical protein TNCV_4673821 [Trichonephila clavipes]|nr:hypothetical protein TNCV_4673821 [Trichonephila clavipes]
MARKGANKKPAVVKLIPCNKCDQKFYTQHGYESHLPACTDTVSGESSTTTAAHGEAGGSGEVKKGKDKAGKTNGKEPLNKRIQSGWRENKRKPIRPTFCRHCNRSIFLSSTLENHYLLKHHRRLSPRARSNPHPPTSQPLSRPATRVRKQPRKKRRVRLHSILPKPPQPTQPKRGSCPRVDS